MYIAAIHVYTYYINIMKMLYGGSSNLVHKQQKKRSVTDLMGKKRLPPADNAMIYVNE